MQYTKLSTFIQLLSLAKEQSFRSLYVLHTTCLYPLTRHFLDGYAVIHPEVYHRIFRKIPTTLSAAIKASRNGSQTSVRIDSRQIPGEYVLGNFSVENKYPAEINAAAPKPTKLVLSIMSNQELNVSNGIN
jgi:hypothetical protein